VTVSISAVPAEYLHEDASTAGTGYVFSYFSSSATGVSIPASPVLRVLFELPVPENYYQVKQFQNISVLQFVVGLVSLAASAFTLGNLIITVGNLVFRKGSKGSKGRSKPDEMSLASL